jgi:Flp pilus assembly protein TadB
MAQTKRKRRSKHRGTAAGVVESRGRTTRPASPQERKKQARELARQTRLNTAPTWRSATNRALLASGFMLIFLLVVTKGKILAALAFAVFALALYIPGGYFLETFLWRRRMRKQPPTHPSR